VFKRLRLSLKAPRRAHLRWILRAAAIRGLATLMIEPNTARAGPPAAKLAARRASTDGRLLEKGLVAGAGFEPATFRL
jgi:hypothetical protein